MSAYLVVNLCIYGAWFVMMLFMFRDPEYEMEKFDYVALAVVMGMFCWTFYLS